MSTSIASRSTAVCASFRGPKPTHSSQSRVWLTALAWAGIIFATSCRYIDRDRFVSATGGLLPNEATREVWDQAWQAVGLLVVKGYHVAEFAILTLLVHSALLHCDRIARVYAPSVAIVACGMYAALDEWHQTFVPGRGGKVSDVAIDVIGIAIAVWLIRRPQPETTA